MGRFAEVWEYASLAHIRGIPFAARHCKKKADRKGQPYAYMSAM